jgi:hypothetical protein
MMPLMVLPWIRIGAIKIAKRFLKAPVFVIRTQTMQ